MKKTKIEIVFIGLILLGMFLGFDTQKVYADACSNAKQGFVCIDSATSANPSNCVTGLCPGAANIQCCPPAVNSSASSGTVIPFTNPLAFKTVEGLLGSILSAIQKIVITLALVFIAIGSIMILTSAGSPEMAEKGKKAITMALVGVAIGIAAPSILKELANILGWGAGSSIQAPTLSQIALNVLSFLLGIAGVLTLIMLVIGAIMYLTSAGDQERIESGKKIFKNSLIGIFIIMASMVLVKQIALFFAVGQSTSAATSVVTTPAQIDMTGL